MRFSFLFVFLFSTTCSLPAQDWDALHDAHERYRDPRITDRRFKHHDIMDALADLPDAFRQKQVGSSVEGRSIHLVSLGEGPVDVLLWSQMHGNEPTATMALLDIFRFFEASDEFDELRQKILSSCTLHFIPMLNPDGAERFQRRNARGVDLNRDALRLQNPEARILKQVRDSLEADWGFNLHDQSRYYSAGAGKPYTASISFLAPAFNHAKDISPKREDAMQLIGYMNRLLQKYIPNMVGKYNDTFEPRAFGDNIQKWGTRTILIETGGMKGDREKQDLRRLNFLILLKAFEGIADGAYENVSRKEYQRLPFNDYGAFEDLIIQGATFNAGAEDYVLDLAFRRNEIPYDNHSRFYLKGSITDIGDLSTSMGYEELNASGLQARQGKVYNQAISDPATLFDMDLWPLVQRGYLYFRMTGPVPKDNKYHNLPVQLLGPKESPADGIQIGRNPAIMLSKGTDLRFLIVNGSLYDVRDGQEAFEAYLR